MKWENLLSEASLHFANDFPESVYNQTVLEKHPLPFRNYYFIFDCVLGQICSISPKLTDILGYDEQEFTIEKLFAAIHPEDKNDFIAHETKALEFCKKLKPQLQNKYKIVHDYRLQGKDGNYIRILQQSYTYETFKGLLKKTMVIHTDISDIKRQEKSELHIIGWDGEPSYYNIDALDFSRDIIQISKRELEIVKLIDQGKTSRNIAEILNISYHTVLKHRKNILNKTRCNSTLTMLKKLKENNIL